jgi:hypothetical protein
VAVFEPARLATRHAEVLESASPYVDSPVRWTLAFGTAAARRAGLRMSAVWRGARARGTPAAALATLAAPVTVPLLVLQTVAGRWLPDVVTPLVEALYAPAPTGHVRSDARPAPGMLAERP